MAMSNDALAFIGPASLVEQGVALEDSLALLATLRLVGDRSR